MMADSVGDFSVWLCLYASCANLEWVKGDIIASRLILDSGLGGCSGQVNHKMAVTIHNDYVIQAWRKAIKSFVTA